MKREIKEIVLDFILHINNFYIYGNTYYAFK